MGSADTYPIALPIDVEGLAPKARVRGKCPQEPFPKPAWPSTNIGARAATREDRAKAPTEAHMLMPTPGLPPPHASCFGRPQLLDSHYARHIGMKDMSYRPERNSCVINGRLWERS